MSKLQDKILALTSELDALLKSTAVGKRDKVLEEVSDELDELIHTINKRYVENNFQALKKFYLKKMKRFEHEYRYQDEEREPGDSFDGIDVNFASEGGFCYSLEPDSQFTRNNIDRIYYLLPNEDNTYMWQLEIDFPDNHENSRLLYDALLAQPLIQEHLIDGLGILKKKVKLSRDVAFDVLYCLTDVTYQTLVKE